MPIRPHLDFILGKSKTKSDLQEESEAAAATASQQVGSSAVEEQAPKIAELSEPLSSETAMGSEDNMSKTAKHIFKYPIAKSSIETVQSIPHPRIIAPAMVSLRNTAAVKPIFEVVDGLNDNALSQLDRAIPQLQKIEPHDVYDAVMSPISSARENTSRLTDATEGMVNDRIVVPARKLVSDVRERYSAVYDNHGKALIRSQVDPIVRPVNTRLEKFVSDHFPEQAKKSPTEGLSNEISRSIRIVSPVIRELPSEVRGHIGQVYKDQRLEQEQGFVGTARASMATSAKLCTEAFQRFSGLFGASRETAAAA
ncbi:hypothetical protein PACTADRAFT_48236 [Pachysolen tannophilus NRRL Y-2460]|uniref:Uncharacterized protein n=1 Tax=Pachysolen tannophilus NRRL Y-2460 TaxID=669874 RepID=A0A1E4U396_PACTA|nr:hypothetical protein PACTADRAFT_48236 [Pachysolen tannophilus NRRL Y-2460]